MGNENFLSKHAGTLLSIGAGLGVAATGLLSCELGRTIEREQVNLKSSDTQAKKSAKLRIGIKAGMAVTGIGVTLFCIVKGRDLSKKEIAALSTALGAQTKLFREYRNHEDPQRDKEIMHDIAMEHVKESKEIEDTDDIEPGLMMCTDPYVYHLSDGKIEYYLASEADILAAANYTINRYCNDGYVTLGTFYDALRRREVNLPVLKGENGISWEVTNERVDYYGRNGFDFDYAYHTMEDGTQVATLIFDDDDEMINENNKKLEAWCESLSAR